MTKRATLTAGAAALAGAGTLAVMMARAPEPTPTEQPSAPPTTEPRSYPCVTFDGWYIGSVDSLGTKHYGQSEDGGEINGAQLCAPGGQHVVVTPQPDGTVELTLGAPIPSPPPPPPDDCDPPCQGREVCVAGVCVPPPPPPPPPPPGVCDEKPQCQDGGPTCDCCQGGQYVPCEPPPPPPSPDPTKTPGSPPPPSSPPPSSPPPSSPPPSSPPPPPPPGPAPWGTDWPWGDPLPAPPAITAASLADDPPGLLREGFGADAVGGNGSGIVAVTKVGPDGAQGTLRWAFNNLTAGARRIVVDPTLSSSTLILDTPLFSKASNITLDCNGASIKPLKQNTNGLGFGAAHDIVVKNCRFLGHHKGSNPNWVPQQNSGNGYLDGDVPAAPCEPWDTVCQGMTPALRRAAVNVIFDQCTWDGIQDDGLSIWGGGRRISFTRNFALRSFHLSTTGWKGTLTDKALMRLWISWHYNVTTKIGERNLAYPREGTHWWFFDRNFVEGWEWYQYCAQKDSSGNCIKTDWNAPYGTRVSGMAPNENNMGWGRANCALGNAKGMPLTAKGQYDNNQPMTFQPNATNSHLAWGLTVDNGGCDTAQACAPNCTKWSGANIPACNPRVAKTKLYFAGNEGEVYDWTRINPPGYVPPAVPYQPDLTRAWSRVLDEAGVPKQWRTADETAELLRLAGRAVECKVPVPPQPLKAQVKR